MEVLTTRWNQCVILVSQDVIAVLIVFIMRCKLCAVL